MRDSMETGGFGKNPAIDKINRINLVDSKINTVGELERKVFQTGHPRTDNILSRRKQLMEEFHIDFRRKGTKENGNILYQSERRMPAGEYFIRNRGDEGTQPAARTAGRIQPDEGRKRVHVISADGASGYRSGGWQRRTDYGTIHQTEDKGRRDLERGTGFARVDGRDFSQIQHVSGIPVQRGAASGRVVSDGDGR